jgi:hypothetical protein
MNRRTPPPRAHSPRVLSRRAGAAVAAILALAILQLAIAGVVVTGGRDDDLTTRRVDTLRAFYAAEAAVTVAIREVMRNADEDGDGTIGAVGSDPAADDDLDLGTATATVTLTDAPPERTLTAQAQSGSARRSITVVIR